MLIEPIARQLTNDREGFTESFGDNIRTLTIKYGSGRAASRALGVPESTYRGWRKGTIPRDARKIEEIRSAARGVRLDPELVARAESGDPDFLLTIKGVMSGGSDEHRPRTIKVGDYVPRRLIRQAIREWQAGDNFAADRTLLDAIDTYYNPFQFHTVEWAGFGSPPR